MATLLWFRADIGTDEVGSAAKAPPQVSDPSRQQQLRVRCLRACVGVLTPHARADLRSRLGTANPGAGERRPAASDIVQSVYHVCPGISAGHR